MLGFNVFECTVFLDYLKQSIFKYYKYSTLSIHIQYVCIAHVQNGGQKCVSVKQKHISSK